MQTLLNIVNYFHPSRKKLASMSKADVAAYMRRCHVACLVLAPLFFFAVEDPRGQILIALWDACVTVFFFACLAEAIRLARWWRLKIH